MSHTSRDASGLGTPSLASRAVTGELEGLLPGVAPVLSASDAGDSDDRHLPLLAAELARRLR